MLNSISYNNLLKPLKFGAIMGTHNNVPAYSNNYKSGCNLNDDDWVQYLSKEETKLFKDVFTGCKWQCVEYARRWLIFNKKCTFKSINFAVHIYDIGYVEDLTQPNKYKNFISIPNEGTTAPEVGDLVIFPQSRGQSFGHVAVVSNINFDLGYLDIVEQNYEDYWEHLEYSRRLLFIKYNNKYVLTEIPWSENILKTYSDKLDNIITRYKSQVVGFKRITEKVI